MVIAGVIVPNSPAVASRGGDGKGFTATSLAVSDTVDGFKSATGRLAESDPSLLGRTDATPVNVMVKLDYDATATYAGGVEGLAATSPRVTGVELTGATDAEVSYESYSARMDAQFRADVARAIPSAKVGASISRVYGGVAMQLPANQVGALLSLPNVAAVQANELEHPQTDASTAFIGAPTIWSQEGGQALAGKGVIFGDLDTGIWPEHPSFADNGILGAPPAKADRTPRVCDYGDNPLTPAVDVFVCNNKLIGGQPFIDTYNALIGGEIYPDTARDSNGHGTHTSSTAAGNIVDHTPIFGVDRGRISGVAPGAWVVEYKVCGLEGCFPSDSAAAVAQAILDGVDVINFSISGGSNPFGDPVELAFLDAYNAGVTVAASAGNSGPGASTTDHLSPWVITVGASTQTRAFQSTLTLTSGAASLVLTGSSITTGISTPTPVVMAEDVAGYNDILCSTPLPAGSVTGLIVACKRGGFDVNGNPVGRVQKGFDVAAGGGAGMILYNLPLQETETDNHFLPTVHLADGTQFLAFEAAHTGAVKASFTNSAKGVEQGDVMAAFSSRGPNGLFIKPDITAPGVQILAGHTPTPDEIPSGPPGQYFQAIAGTSMSSPHIAGSAILLQALHPDWSPGAIKSALMTTSTTRVVKEDLVTPADPFDFGAGRVDLTKAGAAPIVFEDSATNMAANGADALTAINVNIPSVNVPTMPGVVHVVRTARNVTTKNYEFDVSTKAPNGSRIRVVPSKGRIKPGESKQFDIFISSSAPTGQYFGEIRFSARKTPDVHLPVAFFNKQGQVTLSQDCTPASIVLLRSTTCTVTATNDNFGDATVSVATTVDNGLRIVGATGATTSFLGHLATVGPVQLAGKEDATPSIAPGVSPAGYLPLDLFGITPIPIGDEQSFNFNIDDFVFGGKTYNRIGVVSNGYLVLGGTTSSQEIDFIPQTLPNPALPNGVLAPYWTDLNGVDGNGNPAPGIFAGSLTDGVNSWTVIEWRLFVWGTPNMRVMQVWIGNNGVEDVSFTFDPATTIGQDTPPGYGLTVGAENPSGTGGGQITGPPLEDYVITTTPGRPGESLTYSLQVQGTAKGTHTVRSAMTSDVVSGLTIVSDTVTVTRK
jgi:hypothetical protein